MYRCRGVCAHPQGLSGREGRGGSQPPRARGMAAYAEAAPRAGAPRREPVAVVPGRGIQHGGGRRCWGRPWTYVINTNAYVGPARKTPFMMVPIINIVMLYFLAFSTWPSQRKKQASLCQDGVSHLWSENRIRVTELAVSCRFLVRRWVVYCAKWFWFRLTV